MVLKTAKRGVRTGNTLKKCNSSYFHRYRSQSCILRQFVPNAESLDDSITDELGEVNYSNNRLEFSLNKKKRWLLPDKIRNQILEEVGSDDETDMRLTEYHKMRTSKANCIGFTSSKIKDSAKDAQKTKTTKTKRKRRGYFDVSSIMDETPQNNRNRNRNNTQNWENENENEAEMRVPSQLNYQVIYPGPSSSYTSHCHKYNDYKTRYNYFWEWDQYEFCRRGSGGRTKVKMSKFIKEFLEDSESDFDYFSDEDLHTDTSYSSVPQHDMMIELNDIIQFGKEKKLRSHKKLNRKAAGNNECDAELDYFQKNHIKYVDSRTADSQDILLTNKAESSANLELQEAVVNSSLEEGKRNYTIVEPAIVKLYTTDTTDGVLKHKYRNRYIKCNCFPRKFILDISKEINEPNRQCVSAKKKSNTQTIKASLTFVEETWNDCESNGMDTFAIYLNTQFAKDVDYVNTAPLFSYSITQTTIDQIKQRAVEFVYEFNDISVNKDKRWTMKTKRPMKSTLEQCANWDSYSYLPDMVDLYENFIQKQDDSEIARDLGFDMIPKADCLATDLLIISQKPRDAFCAICFNGFGDYVPATALRSCSHWFCDCCWKEHLILCVREGRTSFPCPEFDCDKLVDRGTLLSLLDMTHVLDYLRRCHDNAVEQMSVTKWCPNPVCGRVLKVNSTGVKTTTCVCGTMVCFECLHDVHWPAMCTVADDYRKKLRKNKDDIIPIDITETYTANGKNCPHCRRFVEKNGGCPFMTCICRHTFCWGCGKAWDSAQHGPDCYTTGTLNKHIGTHDLVIGLDDDRQTRKKRITKLHQRAQWYKIAVEHRHCRKLVKLRKTLDSIKKLGRNLAHHVSKAWRNQDQISFDIDIPHKTYLSEASKAEDYLKDTLALYAESHQIVEHVAIFLDSTTDQRIPIIPIQNTINKMSALSDILYSLLVGGYEQDEEYVFRTLKETRHKAKRCIKGLVQYFNSQS